jgi:ATP-dependent helicase/nuclease subunit A
LQGVIDLCFLEDGGWVLVDYKTDRVSSPDVLWQHYASQVDLYRRALHTGTGIPVREATLFALLLGEGSTQY